jgi:hypothetical protein
MLHGCVGACTNWPLKILFVLFFQATLAKMREMEWERRKGYWCTKCNLRFESQTLLVDHMSGKDHADKK